MRASLRGFGLTLIAIWTILTIAGLAYSQQKDIPPAVTRALLPAILLEAAFYLAAAMEPAARVAAEAAFAPRLGCGDDCCRGCTVLRV
jgi:hypothetical protein